MSEPRQSHAHRPQHWSIGGQTSSKYLLQRCSGAFNSLQTLARLLLAGNAALAWQVGLARMGGSFADGTIDRNSIGVSFAGRSLPIASDSPDHMIRVPHTRVSMEMASADPALAPQPVSIEELTVEISASEKASQMTQDSARAAARLLEKHGVCLLRNVLDPAAVSKLHDVTSRRFSEYKAALKSKGIKITDPYQFSEIAHRSRFRHDMQLVNEQVGVEESELHAYQGRDAVWWPLVESILDQDARHVFTGAVVAMPQAESQGMHADGSHLFPGREEHLPPHCINIFVPTVDVTLANGPTEFWPGSQRQALANKGALSLIKSLPLAGRIGDAIVFDYRVIHRGMANYDDEPRPVIYFTFARSWYRDAHNYPDESLMVEKTPGGFGGVSVGVSSKDKGKSGKKKAKSRR